MYTHLKLCLLFFLQIFLSIYSLFQFNSNKMNDEINSTCLNIKLTHYPHYHIVSCQVNLTYTLYKWL